jgi:hypothetical protein
MSLLEITDSSSPTSSLLYSSSPPSQVCLMNLLLFLFCSYFLVSSYLRRTGRKKKADGVAHVTTCVYYCFPTFSSSLTHSRTISSSFRSFMCCKWATWPWTVQTQARTQTNTACACLRTMRNCSFWIQIRLRGNNGLYFSIRSPERRLSGGLSFILRLPRLTQISFVIVPFY